VLVSYTGPAPGSGRRVTWQVKVWTDLGESDLELTPGYTAYRDVLHVQTYDVTDLLRTGENTLGAIVSDGWFRGRTGAMRIANSFGDRTALLCQLHVVHEDESTTVLGTDSSWTTTPAWITAGLMDGQTTDLRRAMPGWSAPGDPDESSPKATVVSGGIYDDFARLTASPAPPVRRIEELTPVSVTELPSGRQGHRPRAEHQRLAEV
jgi:alpha-L-rhamnosidase